MAPRIEIFADKEALSQAAIELFLTTAVKAVAANGRFLVALSGGGTPQGIYALLAQSPYRDQMPWQQTHLFWGDERLVPPDSPGSNYAQAAQTFINQVPIPKANIHRARGELDAAAAVADYRRQLQQFAESGRSWPRLDLALLGMGRDGHTASLFPGPISAAEATTPVMAVSADYDGRPAQRITLTPLLLNESRQVLFLVTGVSKAQTVADVLAGPQMPAQLPAQRIDLAQGDTIWFLDKAAAQHIIAENE